MGIKMVTKIVSVEKKDTITMEKYSLEEKDNEERKKKFYLIIVVYSKIIDLNH